MSRTLEITLISAEDLRIDRRPVKKNAFAVVMIDPFNVGTSMPDECGGSYPTWNEKFEMEMPMNGRVQFISIEVFYRTGSGSDKKVGNARIPVTDFTGGYAPEGHLNFLSYRLRDKWGDRNGIVNVSVRVKADARFGGCERTAEKKTGQAKPDYAACASQAAGFWRTSSPKVSRMAVGISAPAVGFGGRTVTGVPVWCTYQPRS